MPSAPLAAASTALRTTAGSSPGAAYSSAAWMPPIATPTLARCAVPGDSWPVSSWVSRGRGAQRAHLAAIGHQDQADGTHLPCSSVSTVRRGSPSTTPPRATGSFGIAIRRETPDIEFAHGGNSDISVAGDWTGSSPGRSAPRASGHQRCLPDRFLPKDFVSGRIGRPLCGVTDECRNVVDHGGSVSSPAPATRPE